MAYACAVWERALLVLALLGQGGAWDYSQNGADWPGQCGAGGPQSPINLPAIAQVEKDEKLFLKYPKLDIPFQLYHNGNSIAFTLPDAYRGGFGLGKELDGLGSKDASAYRLWQVNFHSPSEHTLKGQQMPLEMQLMHQRVTGGKPEIAVVVVLFQSAANNYLEFLDKLTINGVPKKPWDEKAIPKGLEFSEVLGGSPYYHYGGSLTAPPCERNVKYYVRQEPISTAEAQLRKFSKVLKATCAPNGNFRAVKPMAGLLNLMASVDVVRAPDVTVKPKISKFEANEAIGDPGTVVHTFECPPDFIDDKWKNIGRIEVGDSPEIIKAKETYNRRKREKQVVEGNYGNAVRNQKMAQGLYDASPGLAEKINNKWNLFGANSVLSGASKALASYSSAAIKKNEFEMQEAIHEECKRKLYVKPKEAKKKAVKKKAAPPEVFEKPVYPEPHVKLPTGVEASPFGPAGANEGSGATKLASNLRQEDLPPSSTVSEAEGTKEIKPEPKKPNPAVILSMDLPIAQSKVADKAAFKADLIKALAATAEIPAGRFEVKELKSHKVAHVHASFSLAQKALRGA